MGFHEHRWVLAHGTFERGPDIAGVAQVDSDANPLGALARLDHDRIADAFRRGDSLRHVAHQRMCGHRQAVRVQHLQGRLLVMHET